MNVTLRQLRVFTGVYRTRSITRAARELGITQSAASLLIQQLEAQLGVKLFDRSTRSVQPTLAADEAFAAAERMLSDAQGLSRRMRDLAQARAGRVVFLASAGTASALLPPVLAKFRTGHPDIEIDMRDVAADDLVPRLSTTDAEFAIGSVEGEFADMTIETLTSGRLSAIGRRTADFAARRSLTWDELVQLPTIAMRSETRIRMQIDQALSAQGKRLDPTYEVTLINTALAMTAQGLGLAILPATMLPPDQFPTLIATPLVRPALTRPVSLLQCQGRTLSPAAQAFVATARAVLAGRTHRHQADFAELFERGGSLSWRRGRDSNPR
ncbi:LysR family transcriptional regulator [Bradyrhizobium sp. NBAIM18]|uniref:LysR family transcriptional regulator n=1 Tax=Bradyrhizobium sp. NBAIM18 TaxID=2793812 RepID=UPI001CD6211D|nr:LysR family transcriptional regulator [Bradyrhizobium sp. NBAIM18]